jgi:hypothetical protein
MKKYIDLIDELGNRVFLEVEHVLSANGRKKTQDGRPITQLVVSDGWAWARDYNGNLDCYFEDTPEEREEYGVIAEIGLEEYAEEDQSQSVTELIWHHVAHHNGEHHNMPECANREMLVFTSICGTAMLEHMHWSDGTDKDDLERGFWVHKGQGHGYWERRNDAYIIAWAELPTADEVLTDDEKELYE